MNDMTQAAPGAVPATPTLASLCSIEQLVGPLSFHAITFDEDFSIEIGDAAGQRAELPIDQVWRIAGLLGRFQPREALRLGLFWQDWRERLTRRQLAEIAQ